MGLLGALGELDLELELAAGMGDGEDDGDADEILLADDILHELVGFAFCIWLDRLMGENLVAASTRKALFLYLVL